MADPTDAGSSGNSSSSRPPEWYVDQWTRLCDELGTSDPTDAMARVQAMKRELNRSDPSAQSEEGLVTISEVEEVFREMNRKIENLKERNADLAERVEEEGGDTEGVFQELHQKTEQLLETLDATSIDDARQRIQKMNQRLEVLYHEKEKLAQAGYGDAEEALAELETLREELDQLQDERNHLEQQVETTEETSQSPRRTDPDTSVLEAAVVIRDRIGVSSPAQAEAFTKIVEQLYDRIHARAKPYGAETDEEPDDVVDMLRHMTSQIDSLPDPGALPPEVADALGTKTPADVGALLNSVQDLHAFVNEQFGEGAGAETLDDDGTDARALLNHIQERLQSLSTHGPESDGERLPAEVGDVLGIRSIEDARELEELIADMSAQLERLHDEHAKLEEAGLTVEGAMTMIENMEAQLVDLYHESESGRNGAPPTAATASALDDSLRGRVDALTEQVVETDTDLTHVIERLTNRLDDLSSQHTSLVEAGLSAEEAVTMIESMEVQLNDLYRAKEEGQDAAEQLTAIENVLGISTAEEAEELSEIARQMEEQLSTLYREKARLEDLGVASMGDAVDMIQSMDQQLTELYEDKEALQKVGAQEAEHKSTFEQLESLYAEQEKLQQALGVSSAADVIEMIESLESQLDDVYEGRDAEVDPKDRAEALLGAHDSETRTGEESRKPDATLTMSSMEHQLEALYREKETLLHHGFSDAQEIVQQLQTQQKQIDALQRENQTYEQQFDRLKAELGTASVAQVLEMVQALESSSTVSLEDALAGTSPSDDPAEHGIDIEATSPFVDDETLARLEEMDSEDLDTIETGVVQLSEDGTVEYLNEAALQLPGLRGIDDRSTVVGQNFFLDLAPSTNNNLFYGRFQKGQRRGTMNARFPYTFTSPDGGPQAFDVHLHRKADSDVSWLLFRPA